MSNDGQRLGGSDLFRMCVVGVLGLTILACAICATILGLHDVTPPPGLVGIAATALGIIAGMMAPAQHPPPQK